MNLKKEHFIEFKKMVLSPHATYSVSPGCALWGKQASLGGIDVVWLFFPVFSYSCLLMLNKYSYWLITFTTCVLWLHKSNFQTFHCKSIKIYRLCHQCQWSHRRANGLYNCLYNIHSTGPETSEVVLVSAAHCNFICKVIASCDHLIRIYFFFFKGQRQQRCGDLLLPWIPSPRIVPS